MNDNSTTMSWGTELWDQFDNISLHTMRGIDFCDRLGSFLKERCVIENDYAAKLKKLVKNYQPKKKEENEFTYAKGFTSLLNELNDMAGQHEMIVENVATQILADLTQLIHGLRQERKRFLQDGMKQVSILNSQLADLDKAKKHYEKSHRESERALEVYRKADADIHLSRADVEKAKNNSIARQRTCDESKNAYAAELQKTNQVQTEHYHTLMPRIFDNLQQMEERRVTKVQEYIQKSADIEKDVVPIINTCISGIVAAAKNVSATEDSRLTVERYKSGFLMPTDIPFEEQDGASVNGNHTSATSSVTSTGGSPLNMSMRSRSRSAVRNESMRNTMSGGSTRARKRTGIFGMFAKEDDAKEDYSHLPPNQQKKKLMEKMDALRSTLAKQTAARDGLLKMQDVFNKNPKMGDPASLVAQLEENSQALDSLQQEIRKYEGYLAEAENRSLLPDSLSGSNSSLSMSTSTSSTSQQSSGVANHDSSTPVSSYGDQRLSTVSLSNSTGSGRRHSPLPATPTSATPTSATTAQPSLTASLSPSLTPSNTSSTSSTTLSPASLQTSSEQHDSFENEEYEEDVVDSAPLQPVGTCVALYPFDAPSDGSIPMKSGEEFYIIESDQGDGWTRVRRRANSEEGFVPTTYIRCQPYTSV